MTVLVVIPARWGSTRFPGKPLASIAGHTLLQRTIDLARRSLRGRSDAALVVATDDIRIADHARDVGCDALITEGPINTGSGRALSAAAAWHPNPEFVVNLQGDAPFISTDAVRAVIGELTTTDAGCVTPVVPVTWKQLDEWREHKKIAPYSGTTCLRGQDGTALWFSKAILPAIRDEAARRGSGEKCPVLRHLGLYGYRLAALRRFEMSPPSRYEELEGLEQLRMIELGITIRTVVVEAQSIPVGGIDTPADVRHAERLIEVMGDPFGL